MAVWREKKNEEKYAQCKSLKTGKFALIQRTDIDIIQAEKCVCHIRICTMSLNMILMYTQCRGILAAQWWLKRHTTTNRIHTREEEKKKHSDAHVFVCDIVACECGLERIYASRNTHTHTDAQSGATEIYGAFRCERVCVCVSSSFRRNSTKRDERTEKTK